MWLKVGLISRRMFMRTGTKAQGQRHMAKLVSIRHGHGSRRGCNAQEKAAETKVRQEGRKVCREEASS